MNVNEDSNELLDWDKKNISRFAQYLYNLSKEKVKLDKESKEELELDVTPDEIEIAPIDIATKEIVTEEETVEEIQDIIEETIEEIEEEIIDERIKAEEKVLDETIPDDESVNEIEVKKELEQELEEVTIGLAKAVSGEDVGEIEASFDQEEIQKIIEKEQIPIPSETKEIFVESGYEESVQLEETTSIEREEFTIDEPVSELDSVDLSVPIVKEPVISEDILIQPENIPEDIHKMVFVGEASSVPITRDDLLSTQIDEPTTEDIALEIDELQTAEIETVSEIESIPVETQIESVKESIEMTPEIEQQAIETVPEPEEITEEIHIALEETQVEPETVTDYEAESRRQTIIEQMLAEPSKREEEAGFQVRDLGETEGRAYSAVIVGHESTKNIKKWKKWEKRRLRQEKKKK